MPKFTIAFERVVETVESVTRVVDAPTEAAARLTAASMASRFNDSCPDDIEETSYNNSSFAVVGVGRTD